ncbi:glycosyltransferase [bacterium]|nr:glycosyltransferase [bacterium]
MAANLTVSVVIISFNQRDFTARLVGQLLDQDFPPSEYEVIVVECFSSDGTREALNQIVDFRLRVLKLDKLCNRSAGRNIGIVAAQGDIVVMVDGDHTINRDFVRLHCEAQSRGACAIVGKSVFAENTEYKAISEYLNGGGASKLPPGSRLPGRYFLTRNCSVPKRILLEVGLFDETFDRWGGEDLDLGVRLEEADVPIYADSRALAVHHHFRTINQVMANMYDYGSSSIPLLLKKHPQLFRELNLDHLKSNPYEPDRFTWIHRFIVAALCTTPFYRMTLFFARVMRRRKLPRFILDYLHFRQYSAGYIKSSIDKTE